MLNMHNKIKKLVRLNENSLLQLFLSIFVHISGKLKTRRLRIINTYEYNVIQLFKASDRNMECVVQKNNLLGIF